MESKFKDYYGNSLRNGVYFAGDGLDGDIYILALHESGETFSAKSYEEIDSFIEDYKLFAKQLIPLSNPRSNLEFALLNMDS